MNKHLRNETSVAIIGAGIAGLSCATHLKALGFQVQIFEKSHGVSGRMSTRNTDEWSADHGAQYFTARDPLFIKELSKWIDGNAAAVWNPNIKVFKANQWFDYVPTENRYVGTPSMSSPGKHLAKSLSIHLNQTIDHLSLDHGKWMLHSLETRDIGQQFDWLVLALPAPQAIALAKSINPIAVLVDVNVNMQGCWTLIASFKENINLSFDAAFINGEIISWIARNNSKPNRSGKETLIIHANPQWSQEWIELEKDQAAKHILDCAKKLGLDCDGAQIAIHRWRYASGHTHLIQGFDVYEDIKLGFCGDWLNGGRVEGAWLSGYKLASQIQNIET